MTPNTGAGQYWPSATEGRAFGTDHGATVAWPVSIAFPGCRFLAKTQGPFEKSRENSSRSLWPAPPLARPGSGRFPTAAQAWERNPFRCPPHNNPTSCQAAGHREYWL